MHTPHLQNAHISANKLQHNSVLRFNFRFYPSKINNTLFYSGEVQVEAWIRLVMLGTQLFWIQNTLF